MFGLVAVSSSANAVPITVDTVIADDASITTASASVDMTVSGSTLTITLRNLLSGGPTGAGGLLTGIGFDLPDNVDIRSGSVVVGSGSRIRGGSLNGSGAGTSVSGEWGFNNGTSGHFNGLAIDTQISTMTADASSKFSNTPIDGPAGLSGPDFGLLGIRGNRGGLTAIENSIVITLLMNRTLNGGFLDSVQGGLVAVTFGSPTGAAVPDTAATSMLLGLALLGLEGLRRRMAK
jgi:hypothetical protein